MSHRTDTHKPVGSLAEVMTYGALDGFYMLLWVPGSQAPVLKCIVVMTSTTKPNAIHYCHYEITKMPAVTDPNSTA